MTEDYAIRRREYVADIRKSFDTPEFEHSESMEEPNEAAALMISLKIRLILAIFIFAAFLFCSVTGYAFYGYDAADIVEFISEDFFDSDMFKFF